jgi:VDE lipocalin domain
LGKSEFWENWYVIGENDPNEPAFKFIFYNGKTRQNTYEGAFVYARTRELSPESMKKVYNIAREAGMNPDQFCKIRNGCFVDDTIVTPPSTGLGSPSNPFRGILASTKVSQLLGVEPVAAEQTVRRSTLNTVSLPQDGGQSRSWWYEVGDYLENPHRHFQAMDRLRVTMEWPEDVKNP